MKNLKNLGKALSKAQQKEIYGGYIALPGDPDDHGGGGGGGGGGFTHNCPSPFPNCGVGKCYNLRSCRCSYGEKTNTCV